ncbi:MAG: hypothetical protein HC945_01840, partial [Nitrosarchaeum sp.]|nr:hypothetical protein [Nitrosarchaeum sp.]
FDADDPDEAFAEFYALILAAENVPDPSITTSNASPFAVTAAMIAAENVTLTTHQASVDFDLYKTAPAGTWFTFKPAHSGATVSIQDGAGSISGTTTLLKDAPATAYVVSNAGSAPVIVVFGGIEADTQVDSTRSYTAADHKGVFTLIASAGDQTMPTAANAPAGWYVEIINLSGGAVDIIGADRTENLADEGVLIIKKAGPSLIGIGNENGTAVTLDAA